MYPYDLASTLLFSAPTGLDLACNLPAWVMIMSSAALFIVISPTP